MFSKNLLIYTSRFSAFYYHRFVLRTLSALCLLLASFASLQAQNALPGCDKYTLLVSEFTGNFASSNIMAIDFPTPVGQSMTMCNLGAGAGNDGIAIDAVRNIAYSVSGDVIKVYNYATGAFEQTFSNFGQNGGTYDLALSLDRSTLYVAGKTGLTQLNALTGAVIQHIPSSTFIANGGLWGVGVHPTTGVVYVTSGFEGTTQANTVQLLPANLTGTPTIVYTAQETDGELTGLTFAADGTMWVVYKGGSTQDYLVHLTATGTVIGQFTMPASTTNPFGGGLNDPFDIAIGPDNALYIATFYGPCVLRFDPATNTYSTFIPNEPGALGKGLAFVCGNFKCPCNIPGGQFAAVPGTCVNGQPANNGTATMTGASLGMKAGIKAGATYGTTPVYSSSLNVPVTSGSASFSGLSPATTYSVRVWNGSDGCYTDYSFLVPAATCVCPPNVCAPMLVRRNR